MVKYIILFLCVLTLESQANMHRRARHFNARDAGATLVLDSRFITGLADGDPVATWSDRSRNGNDATQATPSNRPTFKTNQQAGNSGVEFTAGLKQLETASVSLPQPAYFMVCAKQLAVPQPANTGRCLDSFSPGTNIGPTNNKLTIFTGSVLSGSTNVGINTCIMSSIVNGASSFLFLDGTQDGSGNSGSSSGSGTISIGSNRVKNTAVGYFNGQMFAVTYIASNPGNPLRRRIEHAAALSFKIPCN